MRRRTIRWMLTGLALSVMACGGPAPAPMQQTGAPTAGAVDGGSPAGDGITRIGVMLFEGVLTSDVTGPMEVFGAAIANGMVEDYEVVTIAPEPGTIRSNEGVALVADYGLADAPPLDVLIVGSRYDMDPVLDDEAFMAFVRERGSRASWLASNCSGAYVLAAAGFLDGRRATTYPGGEVWLNFNHPAIDIEMGETVVVDGNVVTSNGSLVSYKAAIELLRRMEGADTARDVADAIYYTRLLELAGPVADAR